MDKQKELFGLFAELKLKAFGDHYKRAIGKNKNEVEAVLLELCLLEVDRRFDAKVKNRIKQATFPKIKTMAMLDYELVPRLPRDRVEELATCEFIRQNRNVILVGDSGGGKTHLAIALGIEACKKNLSVKFYGASTLVNQLLREYRRGEIEKFMARIRKHDAVIKDEMGYVPFSKKGAELLFTVCSDRYEAGSLIITSNLNFSKWTEVFGDKTMTTALLDRLVHKATIIKYDWGSVRFNQAMEEHGKIELS